ncbi:MAG: OST-HTH/LOTUS domain-containing protein [Planctomycetes bacterium]|nr:OST-HTH/LOTUS domain-containing protein [Planctomycetota bacterium]
MSSLLELKAYLSNLLDENQGRILFARMGSALRNEFEKDFQPANYGFDSLRSLASACGDVGEVRKGTHDLEFVRTRRRRLRSDCWKAVTGEGAQAWVDLAERKLESDTTVVELEPERYLVLPKFTTEAEVAESWAEGLESKARDILVDAAREFERGKFFALVREHGLVAEWRQARSTAVFDFVQTWCTAHNVNTVLLLDSPQKTPSPKARSVPVRALPKRDHGEVDLRQLLHTAIEEMSLAELEQIWIPLRFFKRRSN